MAIFNLVLKATCKAKAARQLQTQRRRRRYFHAYSSPARLE
jgi:hypothetical protein